MHWFTRQKVQLNVLGIGLLLLSSCAAEQHTSQNQQTPTATVRNTPPSTPSSDPSPIILSDPPQPSPTASPSQAPTPAKTPSPPSKTPSSFSTKTSTVSPTPAGKPSPTPTDTPAPPQSSPSQPSPPKVSFSQTPYTVINEAQQNQFQVQGQQIFSDSHLPNHQVDFNEADLLAVLINVNQYFKNQSLNDPTALREGILGTGGVTVQDIQDTLAFMITTLEQDIALQRPSRLKDPNFINTHFQVVKWQPLNPQEPTQNQIRITKYAVFSHQGSRTKTAEFDTPIYQLKPEFAADKFFQNYSKQEVLAGLYESGGQEQGKVEPLAYLTRQGLEDALLQGTILIQFEDGASAYFNVDRNNSIAYVRGLPQREQKRYWYFKQVEAIKGYGPKQGEKIAVRPGVTFAGDVLNIGLGKIIMLEHDTGGAKQLNMGVLADTGGAFLPNLYQLDFLAGVFPSHDQFKQHISTLPAYANAYILIRKKNS